MAVNYNFLKSLKGTAIGTIVPWTGDISQIPSGWLQCNFQTLRVDEFPLLYEVVGNRYGGTLNVDFKLPNIQSKSMTDYHPSHDSISGYDIPQNFRDLMGDDGANQVNFVRTSQIDLYAEFNQSVNNMLGFVTEVNLNDPVFFDGLATTGRALGDHHIGTHSHGGGTGEGTAGTGSFEVVSAPNQWAEACQNNGNANCFLFCPDDCGSPQFNRMEANNPVDERQRIGVFDGSPVQGEYITRSGSYQSAGGWAARRNPGQNGSSNYNYVDTNNMDTLSDIQDPWSFAAVDTSHPFVNFLNSGQDSLDAHYHPSQFYSITKGSMNLPATLVLNNVQRGNMQPVNDSLEGIASIRVNTQTPQLNVLHIIRAY